MHFQERNRVAQASFRQRQRENAQNYEDMAQQAEEGLMQNELLSQRFELLQAAVEMRQALETNGIVAYAAADAQVQLTTASIQDMTLLQLAMLWRDLRDRLADLLQGRRPLSEERSEAMREALGQGLGLVLCVTALNRTLMLRLLAARLGLGSPQENAQPLPARHWAQVLDGLDLTEPQGQELLAMRRQHWQQLGQTLQGQEQQLSALQSALSTAPARPELGVQAAFTATALQAASTLGDNLQLEADCCAEYEPLEMQHS